MFLKRCLKGLLVIINKCDINPVLCELLAKYETLSTHSWIKRKLKNQISDISSIHFSFRYFSLSYFLIPCFLFNIPLIC